MPTFGCGLELSTATDAELGHYARTDVFWLVVNEAPTPAVARNSEAVRVDSVSGKSCADRHVAGGSVPRPNQALVAIPVDGGPP